MNYFELLCQLLIETAHINDTRRRVKKYRSQSRAPSVMDGLKLGAALVRCQYSDGHTVSDNIDMYVYFFSAPTQ